MIRSITEACRRLSIKFQKHTDRFLGGSHNHFSWFLPEDIGSVASYFIRLFFSGITLNRVQLQEIKQLPSDAVIIYVNQLKSKFEFLFFYHRFREENLPFPQLGFEYRFYFWQPVLRLLRVMVSHIDFFFNNGKLPDPYADGYIQEELTNNRTGFLSLVEEKGFYRRFVKANTDPIHYFIDMQKETDRPIILVPLLMSFGKKPQRSNQKIRNILFGQETQPGLIRRILILFRNPEKIFIDVSEPVNLKTFLERQEIRNITDDHLSLTLRRDLLLQINRHRQSITGPILKSKQELKESILTNEELQQYLTSYAQKRNIPIYNVRKEAGQYLDEIAASYSSTTVNFMKKVVEWLTTLMFDGVSYNEEVLNKIKFMSFRGPLVIIPCHKSHIDYLIISYILFINNMQAPHIAAGKNLSFWPIGPIFRGGGAFFLRRTFRGAVLYSKIFSEYVFNMLKEGFNIEFFIEGGRSRTGKLAPPKLGLLNILLNAYKSGACPDLVFVPVYIGYDRVIEESSYLHELEGGQKQSEDFSQLIKARKFLKKRYGKIYIKFYHPMSLNELLGPDHIRFADMSAKDQNKFCKDLGYKVMNYIDRKTVVTPHALVAAAILNRNGHRFSIESVNEWARRYMNFLLMFNCSLADTLLLDPDHAIQTVLEDYEQRKLIETAAIDKAHPISEKNNYLINEHKRPSLDYYKNNCINFFIPAAFTALNILKIDAFQFSSSDIFAGYLFFQDLFKLEFSQDMEKSPEIQVKKSIKAFMEEAALVPHPTLPDTYNLTSAGYRVLKNFSMFIAPYLESYLVVLHYLNDNPEKTGDQKEKLKKIRLLGDQMMKGLLIERKESLSLITFANALDTFTSGMLKEKNGHGIDQIMDEIRSALNVLKR